MLQKSNETVTHNYTDLLHPMKLESKIETLSKVTNQLIKPTSIEQTTTTKQTSSIVNKSTPKEKYSLEVLIEDEFSNENDEINKENLEAKQQNIINHKHNFDNIKINVNAFNNIAPVQTYLASTTELINRRFKGICLINDVKVNFSLDTMCDITTISEATAERIKAQIISNEEYETMLADGSRSKVKKARVSLQLGSQRSTSEIMILPSLPVDCLLGQDVFHSHPELKNMYEQVKTTIQKLSLKENQHKTNQFESSVILMTTAETIIDDEEIEQIVARIDKTGVVQPGELERVEEYLKKFATKVSSTELSDLTPTDIITHKIELTNNQPVRQKCRPIPIAKKALVEKKLEEMLLGGLIIPSNSPWRSPMHIVNKKDGDLRITIDYRALNERTVKDALTVPYVKDLFQKIQDSKWFSKADFASGYFQIKMDPASQKYTAFLCEFGLFEFQVMAMGLTNACASFQRFVYHIFADYLATFVKAYIDDILIHSKTLREHIRHVKLVLFRIGEYQLKIKLEKCEFVRLELSFLGHLLSKDKIKPMHEKISKLHQFKTPKNINCNLA